LSCFQVGVCSVVGEKLYVMFSSWGVLCCRPRRMSCIQAGVCSVVGEKLYVMFSSWGVLYITVCALLQATMCGPVASTQE